MKVNEMRASVQQTVGINQWLRKPGQDVFSRKSRPAVACRAGGAERRLSEAVHFWGRLLSLVIAVLSASIMLGATTPAFAVTYSFTQLNAKGTDAVSDQLGVDVVDSGDGTVSFTFTNDVGQESSITDVYLTGTDGLLVLPGEIADQSAGVSYSTGASPSNLPVGTSYDFYATAGADSNPPVKPNGVNASGEYVTWTFSLASGATYQDVIGAINTGTLRIGALVPGSSGGSSSFIVSCGVSSCLAEAPTVPLPASLWLMLGALGGLACLSRRGMRPKRRAAEISSLLCIPG